MTAKVRGIFRAAGGFEHLVETEAGVSLMEAAVLNGVDGIEAVCGGACACATCHVYVGPEWLDALKPPSETENEMLDCVAERAPHSRLSCQIRLTDLLDGLTLELPKAQS